MHITSHQRNSNARLHAKRVLMMVTKDERKNIEKKEEKKKTKTK